MWAGRAGSQHTFSSSRPSLDSVFPSKTQEKDLPFPLGQKSRHKIFGIVKPDPGEESSDSLKNQNTQGGKG
jgi:hypothetical protein